MPLWKIHHPAGAYTPEEKKEFSGKVPGYPGSRTPASRGSTGADPGSPGAAAPAQPSLTMPAGRSPMPPRAVLTMPWWPKRTPGGSGVLPDSAVALAPVSE